MWLSAGSVSAGGLVSASACRRLTAGTAHVALLGTLLAAAPPTADAGGVLADDTTTSTLPCVLTVRGLDAGGHPLFQSVAVALSEPDRAAVPLGPLERGGARWDRLEVAGRGSAPVVVSQVIAVDAAANLAVVEAVGLAACDAASQAPGRLVGASIRVARERVGYRPSAIGGHVERVVTLPGGASVVLVRLLDDGGADPGLVFDTDGRFLGSTLPSPTPHAPTLVAFMPWDEVTARAPTGARADPARSGPTDAPVRAALPPRETPSAAATDPGLVARALLAAGPDAAEHGLLLLDEVIGRDGESAPLLVERGVLRFKANRLAAAVADFERAVTLDPASHIARFNLGIALGTAGRYGDAAGALRAARDLDPTHARTRYQLALALKAARQADEARRECADLETLDPRLAGDLRALIGP